MNDLERALTVTLAAFMSEIMAQSVRRRAQAKIGVFEGRLRREDFPRLQGELLAGIRLFVQPSEQPNLIRQLAAFASEQPAAPTNYCIDVRGEDDISQARLEVRRIALQLGANDFQAQRAATATSELVRNIVMYAGAGRFECTTQAGPPASLRIEARDSGPGIADLPLVLSGRYRSRTGLGRGLAGVKRLADRFEAKSGPSGTTVHAIFQL